MSISEILAKQKGHAEAFLLNTEKREKIILYPYDLRIMVKEQLRLIEALKYLLAKYSLDTQDNREIEKLLLGVKVE